MMPLDTQLRTYQSCASAKALHIIQWATGQDRMCACVCVCVCVCARARVCVCVHNITIRSIGAKLEAVWQNFRANSWQVL